MSNGTYGRIKQNYDTLPLTMLLILCLRVVVMVMTLSKFGKQSLVRSVCRKPHSQYLALSLIFGLSPADAKL